MVYNRAALALGLLGSEVDLNGSLWYKPLCCICCTESVLKLTSTGHYGIQLHAIGVPKSMF